MVFVYRQQTVHADNITSDATGGIPLGGERFYAVGAITRRYNGGNIFEIKLKKKKRNVSI